MKRRRIWISSPVYYVLAAAMLCMAAISLFWSPVAFVVEAAVAVAACVAVILGENRFKAHIGSAVRAAKNVLTAQDYDALEKFSIPVAAVAEEGDLVWANEAFLQAVSGRKDVRGDNVLRFIYPKTLHQVAADKGTDITIQEKEYTVHAVKTFRGYVLYFIDDTYYKDINRRYNEKRPVVASISFDNREELARDSSGMEDARISSEVESVLSHWAQEMGGFLKKVSGSRFLMMTDEAHIVAAKEKRFEILDKVREIKTNEGRRATVSIGVGRGASSLEESEHWARQALDMALGRGGDQVAVKQKDDTYEFFGGLSKGVEKRDKVRTRVIAATLSDHVNASDVVLIMGHKFSDLDSVGSAVGMWSAVAKGLGHEAYIVIDREQSLAKQIITSMEKVTQDRRIFIEPWEAMPMITGKTLLIVVDTHSPSFVESPDLLRQVSRVVVIDHHRMMVKHIDNAIVFYHEPYASSASEMVAELVQYISGNCLSRMEAEALMAGIMLDTKSFVLKTGVRTFEASAYLRRRGADTVEVKRLFSNSIDTYKAKSQLVSSAEIYNNCAIACSAENIPDIRVASAQAADELLSIQGVTASFVLFQTGSTVSISARSLGDVNVQILMEALGGGGHLTMAGAQLANSNLRDARQKLISVLNEQLESATQHGTT